MIYVMNTLVSWVDALPFSIIKGLYVSPFEFALLLVAFVLLLLLVTVRKKRMLFEMLSVLLLFMVSVTVRLYSVDSQNEMVFFSLRKHTAVDFVKGGQHVLLADTALMADASTVDYSLSGFWTRHDLTSHPKVVGLEEDFDGDFVRKLSNLVSFEGKLIALWDSSCAVEDVFSYRLPVDYLLITGISKGDIKNTDLQLVTNCYNPKMLLVGSTVPRYLAAKWVSQAADLNLPCYDLGDGAFQVDLSSENTNILKY